MNENKKKTKNFKNNKKNYRKPNENDSRFSGKGQRDMESVTSNSIEWWNQSPTYNDANRIPFNTIPGYVYPNSYSYPDSRVYDNTVTPDDVYATSIPGVMSINYVPFTGPAKDWNDPLNKSWMSVFSVYASKTSGTFQIQQADLALVGEAANNIIVNIYEAKRLMGLSHLFSNVNQFMPQTLIRAAGYDPDTIIGHEDEIRRELNYYISAFNALNLPGYTNIHLRRAQLAHNVYADEDNIRAQFTLFRSAGYYIYRDIQDEISDAEHLEYVPWAELENRDINDLLKVISDQINALRNSASFGLVSAAVLRAFGDRQLLRIEILPIDYVIIPVYDRNMNWQIQNADFLGSVRPESLHITVDIVGNALQCTPMVDIIGIPTQGYRTMAPQRVLNSYDGNFDQEFVMEATRLKVGSSAAMDPEWDPSQDVPLDICGTEICLNFNLWNIQQSTLDSIPEIVESPVIGSVYRLENSANAVSTFAETISDISKFRFHPYIDIFYLNADNETIHHSGFGDLSTWTFMDVRSLEGLHTAALQSIYTLNPSIEVGNKM